MNYFTLNSNRLRIIWIAISLILISCDKDDPANADRTGSIIKKFDGKEELITAVSTFLVDFGGSLDSDDQYFSIREDYPQNIEQISYNLSFTRQIDVYQYRRQIIGLILGVYLSFDEFIETGNEKVWILVEDDRLDESRYQNVRIVRNPYNSDTSQSYAAYIDLTESHNNVQILRLASTRSGFNGNEDLALPIIDDEAAVTYILAQLQDL